MIERHVSSRLAAYIDAQIPAGEAREIEDHLKRCSECASERERIAAGIKMLDHLEPANAPAHLWSSIEAALENAQQPKPAQGWRFAAVAAAAAICITAALLWQRASAPKSGWEVVRVEGSPEVASRHIISSGRIGDGDWIETDASSRARIQVGTIGSIEVAPNTRVRRVRARPGEDRLMLARGDISAKVQAPPRLFLVDTPSGTAVDLGCEYRMHTGEDGSGLLRVTLGWVSFEWQGRESLVPAGASCRTAAGIGPGTPCFEDAADTFKRTLARFDFEHGGPEALRTILTAARARDSLTLWNLLARVGPAERPLVLDRMTEFSPLPLEITREQVLSLDRKALDQWREQLSWDW